jgi:K+-sensing histidine kinase KdpD
MLQAGIENDASVNRRTGRDRRKNRFPTLKGLILHRRRGDVRRRSDRNRFMIMDRYSTTGMWVIVLVLLLSVADGFLTLFLLEHGAMELNPVMAFFLNISSRAFVGAKYLLTALSVCIVVVLNYAFVRRLRLYASELLKYFAAAFGAVVGWEVYLIFRFVL